jgi:predicted Na+-dependent transporter
MSNKIIPTLNKIIKIVTIVHIGITFAWVVVNMLAQLDWSELCGVMAALAVISYVISYCYAILSQKRLTGSNLHGH